MGAKRNNNAEKRQQQQRDQMEMEPKRELSCVRVCVCIARIVRAFESDE